MDIPIQITDKEDTAVELLKRSLETALYKADIELTIPSGYTGVRGFYTDNIKVKKIAYSAIEEFDLPVVRTWYKYGQFEPYNRLRPKALNIGPQTDEAYVPSPEKLAVTEDHLVEHFLDLDFQEIFSQDLFEFLFENYREWNPNPYTETYLASTELIQVLENIEEQPRKDFINYIGDDYGQFKDASLDLRYQLGSLEWLDENMKSHVGEYLTCLDDALMKVEETSEVTEDQKKSIEQSRIIYHNYVLPWIGIQISLDKAEGPEDSIKTFDQSGQDILKSDKRSWKTQLKGWNADLQEKNLKPDYGTIRSAGPKATTSIKNLQDASFKNI